MTILGFSPIFLGSVIETQETDEFLFPIQAVVSNIASEPIAPLAAPGSVNDCVARYIQQGWLTTMREVLDVYPEWLDRFKKKALEPPIHPQFIPSDRLILLNEIAVERFVLNVVCCLQGKYFYALPDDFLCAGPSTQDVAPPDGSVCTLVKLLVPILSRVNEVRPSKEEYAMLDFMLYLGKRELFVCCPCLYRRMPLGP